MCRPLYGILLSSSLLVGGMSYALPDEHAAAFPFVQDLSSLKSSLNLQVTDKLEKISIPFKKLKLRAQNPKNDPTIEPLAIHVPRSETGLEDLIGKIAQPGKGDALQEVLLDRMKKQGPSAKATVKVDLESKDLSLINLKALGEEMSKENHDVTLLHKNFTENPNLWSELRAQLNYVLHHDQISQISKKIKSGADLSLTEDLLPPFAKRMVGKFIVYRGPNCFHAALAFFDQKMTRLPSINVKEEEGYHKAMINYDELWRVINTQFYEIDPRVAPLKYGDMLVFFAAPEESTAMINFKWIRHTAIYLVGPYTFSKGSKSPNTPYSVKTLEEEWTTWREMTPNLGLKVYRRQLMNSEIATPTTRIDWIY